LKNSPKRHTLTLELKRQIRYYMYFSPKVVEAGENANKRPLHISNYGTGSLNIYLRDKNITYTLCPYKGKLAVRRFCSTYSTGYAPVELYDSFADIGQVELSANYRRKTIRLN
jgi:hypothetical protein